MRAWARFTPRCAAPADRWIITADHGNAETMIDPVTKGPHTYHTTNPVPFILVNDTRVSCVRAARCRTSRPPFWDSWTKNNPRK